MPAARGVKRTAASKSSASLSSASTSGSNKNKKKRNAVQLEVPSAANKRGRVFACGQGDVGQLGLGEDVVELTKFKCVPGLGDKIVDVCAGGMHTVALDSDGKVWTFGCNDEGALGRPTAGDGEEGTPSQVALPERVVCIAAGDSHSAALTVDGNVYAWGAFRDSHGSMGLVVQGREGKPCRDPVKVEINETAAAIASGGDHLVILTTSGSVYTMGCGEQGQLGRLSQRSASRDTRQGFAALLVPAKVSLKAGASRIWAGYFATVVLDAAQEKVFAWGLNNYGQLGITGEQRKTALFSPMLCDAFNTSQAWQQVACGQHHSLALDSNGKVYAVGRCEYGRLGLGERTGDADTLEPIPDLQDRKVVSIACGTSNSFAVTDKGEVLSWGMGSEGQLGTGSSSDCEAPCKAVFVSADTLNPLHISAGGQHTVCLVEDPKAKKETTPAPQKETADQKVSKRKKGGDEEEDIVPEKKPKGRVTKRGKKQDQEEEVSSTSSTQDIPDDVKPQKVNGDEKKETVMEVDETDNPQADKKVMEQDEQQTTPDAEEAMITDNVKKDTQEKPVSGEKTVTPTPVETKTDNDVEMTDQGPEKTEKPETKDKIEVNGAPDIPMEVKTIESLAEPLTTSA